MTGQGGLFTEDIIRDMAGHVERPIIFPLSNPTSRAEATPADLLKWTDGKAIIATGSPFDPVEYGGKEFVIAQSNNSYIFPAMGLAICAVGANRVVDEMFMVAGMALREVSSTLKDHHASLLPKLDDMRIVSKHIAMAVAAEAQKQGLAEAISEDALEKKIDETMWAPEYRPLKRA